MVLIIDSHHPVKRTETIAQLCQGLGVEVRVVESVEKALAGLDVDPQLVLLHCGDQEDAALALCNWKKKWILAYYGGWGPNESTAAYFANNPSERHGLIPKTVPLDLELEAGAEDKIRSGEKLDSDALEKLKNCLQLILQQGKLPPAAIEEVYGDPELERVLDSLYQRLTSENREPIDDLRQSRDRELQQYYAKKRGW